MHTISPPRAVWRALTAATLALAVTASVAACGGDSAPPPAGPAQGASSEGFPKTVQNVFGPVQIPAPATRVVALSKNDAEAAISVGLTPVGVSSGLDSYPWLQAPLKAANSTVLADEAGTPIEQIAGLRPDLILTSDTTDPADYQALTAIAPVVTRVSARNSGTWQDFTRRVGDVTGRTAQANAAISDTETKQKDLIARYPAIAGKTFSLSILSPSAPFVIFKDDAPAVQFFTTTLGMRRSPSFDSLANGSTKIGESGYLSLEQLNLLDADVVVTSFSSPDDQRFFSSNRVFADMGASKRNAVVALDTGQVGQLSLPSALGNVPNLEQVLPKLDAAARTAGS